MPELETLLRRLFGDEPWPVAPATPDARDPLPRETLGITAVQLALSFAEWVRRRRTTVSYVEDTTIRQRMSVDFALPGRDWFWAPTPPEPGDTIYVPLHSVTKETLTNFNAYDEDSRRLSVLNTDDNSALATAGLFTIVKGIARSRHAMADDDLASDLREIVSARKTAGHDPVEEVLEPKLAGELGEVLSVEDDVKALVTDLAGGLLLLVPVEYRPAQDRVLKVEWDAPNYWHGKQETHAVMRWAQSALAAVGWADKRQNIPSIELGWARSTHVEIVAPEDVELTAVTLNFTQHDPVGEGTTKAGSITAYDQPRINVHAALRAKRIPAEQADDAAREAARQDYVRCRGDSGSVDVALRPELSGVFLAAVVASLLTTILLWVVQGRLAQLDVQSGSALLLVLPVVVAAYLARQGEHAFATRLLVGVRLCALIVGLCSLAMAAMVGLATIDRPMAAPRPPVLTVNCEADNDSVGPPRRRRSELDALACVLPRDPAPPPASSIENETAERWAERAALLATGVTGVLLVGFLRTWVWAGLMHRRRPETFVEDVVPQAGGVG